ncbi:MAG: AAA family ATPase [Patescibacteria group bacterium]|jgi:dephospho-CoA kinase
MDFKVIGVVGQIASGKGILVKYLTEKLGFTAFSLSSIVHKELEKKGSIKFTRQTLQDVGDELRGEYGDDILAQRIIKAINEQKKDRIVIEGIRNPGEIEFLKKNSNFILIGVRANRELRFKRVLSRGKEWDPKTYEDFVKVDKRDLGVGQQKSGQQVGKCLAYCDYILTNNKDLGNFEKKVEKLFIHKLFPGEFVEK